MGHPPDKSSHSKEVDVSEVQRPIDTRSPEKSDVLRHIKDFREPTHSEITKVYSSAWADFKAAMNVLNDSGERYKETVHRWEARNMGESHKETDLRQIAKHIGKSDQQFDAYCDARTRFSQTPEGMILKDMDSAMKKAREDLARTNQMKKLEEATAATENAEEALYATSEWKQLDELEPIVFKARQAWVDLQEQAMLYHFQGQDASKPKVSEQFLRQALGIPKGAIPKPDASVFHETRKAWRQNKKEFQAFREQNKQKE